MFHLLHFEINDTPRRLKLHVKGVLEEGGMGCFLGTFERKERGFINTPFQWFLENFLFLLFPVYRNIQRSFLILFLLIEGRLF